MGKIFTEIDHNLQSWLSQQQIFFVATAPLSADGHINCSPKGADSFRVINPKTVAYQDLTGSGIETIAHLQENSRIVIMFCAFTGAPQIVRLHGKGTPVFQDNTDYPAIAKLFQPHPGERAIIKIDVQRISTSCGYSVPLYDYIDDRDVLDKWTEKKSPEELAVYRQKKNQLSIDGLPGLLS
ncbi:pyridoxamine 5'-phosphate oxidase [Pleurocapsa sp. CCALA 161]|uniref:pyridoxamine 5'-phosphate oxidase family protein n=1 Tax=Pleurocapsa sp. CCALA 161 TaxID=2107688 RepID=UPI000D062BC1|nr:pyridoxamine 5'-phosphate oxidase family protein [Pleurocapsa sp. CCALA 161]PSB09421.1 pyridoxamine 5'-phosphate oxidase [Pleurocapsa sp. CCALA 161]